MSQPDIDILWNVAEKNLSHWLKVYNKSSKDILQLKAQRKAA